MGNEKPKPKVLTSRSLTLGELTISSLGFSFFLLINIVGFDRCERIRKKGRGLADTANFFIKAKGLGSQRSEVLPKTGIGRLPGGGGQVHFHS